MKIDENILTDEGKVICDLTNIFTNKNREIKRLNNIINELEKKLLELRLTDVDGKTIVYRLLDKLQELKGSNEPSFEEMCLRWNELDNLESKGE